VSSGYSDRALVEKLGFKPGARYVLVNPPANFDELLGELPPGTTRHADVRGPVDVIVCFVTVRRLLQQRMPALMRAMDPAGMLWVAWPKKASGVKTDMTEDVVRAVALPRGLVDTKVCAIDETWSGLRLVIRRELR
jgi:hypothetical protein